ncbi:ATP-grasp domain-containing protein [Halomonas campisalis]|uniref:ATP-grasp domain-containing protein n=1 Tax=Billgrantia campisalis TaxID=74661 RepID=A0ABS9P716_9GAMM|nr:ATP-grasp domain-containing protein [Halomonas campisalis]MCG6657576.1 ATP-grasp domain-containing protein [Halomonas campisalis]MDR5862650.1 ATP-grasp domain-containing protein [Halomonas campisalis]
MATKNVFVFGLNDFNRRKLEKLRGSQAIDFHQLLDRRELVERRHYPIEEILENARQRLRDFPGSVDGIVHYIDFPVSTIVPILAEEFGLPSASLSAVLKCEHKYWARVEQAKVVPECVPPFAAFDPFDDAALERLEREVGYPMWIKPIKSFSSYLGFRVDGPADFHAGVTRMRDEISRFQAPFDYLLEKVARPSEVAEVGGGHCIAEGIIDGRQCTLEGYGHQRRIEVYGAVDSLRHANRSTFGRYQYPSTLPERVLERMEAVTRRFMRHIGYDNAPFNVEFFWDEESDRIWLLEVNTRISESHCDLFEKVDGSSHHQVAVDLALGRAPDFTKGAGEYPIAGKFFLRTYGDARLRQVPDADEIRRVERQVPGATIQVQVEEGGQLSELMDQDSYSFCLALVFIGAEEEAELLDKFDEVGRLLTFEFDKAC